VLPLRHRQKICYPRASAFGQAVRTLPREPNEAHDFAHRHRITRADNPCQLRLYPGRTPHESELVARFQSSASRSKACLRYLEQSDPYRAVNKGMAFSRAIAHSMPTLLPNYSQPGSRTSRFHCLVSARQVLRQVRDNYPPALLNITQSQ